MPYKPKHICYYPGCGELTYDKYCPAHAKENNSRYEKYARDPETRKRYGSAWRRLRAAYLAEHPLCEECSRNGRLVPAEEVHHILPLDKGGSNSFDNLMALCKPCHSSITAREWTQ